MRAPHLLALLAAAAPALDLLRDEGFGAGDERTSLEELLRETRRLGVEARAALEAPVAGLMSRLEALGTGGSALELNRIKGELVDLGPDAAPLLARHLDPGALAGDAERATASHVADVLQRLPTSAVTERLIQLAREGSKAGRMGALRVLGTSPDVERASACLADLYQHSKGRMRTAALTSLARLGGERNQSLLLSALDEQDKSILRAVLVALTEVGNREAMSKVRDLSGVPDTAAALVAEILAYYSACADAIGEDDVHALIRLAAHDRPSDRDRIAILNTLASLGVPLTSKLKKLFEPLLASADNELREAAQLCMAQLGDRNQRRELIRRYTDLVQKNDNWYGAYEKRGDIYLRLGEYGDAIKDFKKAIKTLEAQERPIDEDLQVELARAYSLDKNAKKAAEALQDAGLSRSELRRLAQDPDFKVLAQHSRHGKIFDV